MDILNHVIQLAYEARALKVPNAHGPPVYPMFRSVFFHVFRDKVMTGHDQKVIGYILRRLMC
jgi:hypothetical protein